MSAIPDAESLRARLAAVGVRPERVDDAAAELGERLAHLAALPDERLEGIPPAVEFRLIVPDAEEP